MGFSILVINLKLSFPKEKEKRKGEREKLPNLPLLFLENSAAKFGNNLMNTWLE